MTDRRLLEIDYATPPANGDIPTYDSTTASWLPAAGGGGGGITVEQAQDAIGTILLDTATIDFTYDDPTPSISAIVIDDSITNTKLANVATQTFKGRTTGGTGDPEDLTIAQAKTLLNLTGTNTGDQTTIVAISSTKAEFDTACSDGNFLYVGDVTTNATHTGEVTGSGALTVDKTAITNKTLVTAEAGDKILVADASDSENLKYVTAQTIADLATGGVSDGDKGDITVTASGATWTIDGRVVTGAKIALNTILTENISDAQVSTAKIVDDNVLFSKIQNIATAKLLGRGTALTGDVEEITLGTNLSFTGTTLDAASPTTIVGITGSLAEFNTALTGADFATGGGTVTGASSGTNTGDQSIFQTIAVAGQSDVVADSTTDTLTLVAGSNISITTNAGTDSITITGTASGSFSMTETEIDFGTTPQWGKTFTVVDGTVSGASKISAWPSGNVATSRVGNDNEWDMIICTALAGTGEFTLTAMAMPGPIVGKRKVYYAIA